MMWLRRSLKNSGTPSYPERSKDNVVMMFLECRLVSENMIFHDEIHDDIFILIK